jgi:hypothetical protein
MKKINFLDDFTMKGLKLFKNYLILSKKFPLNLRPKFVENVKSSFLIIKQVYPDLNDNQKIELLNDGQRSFVILEEISNLPKEHLINLDRDMFLNTFNKKNNSDKKNVNTNSDQFNFFD